MQEKKNSSKLSILIVGGLFLLTCCLSITGSCWLNGKTNEFQTNGIAAIGTVLSKHLEYTPSSPDHPPTPSFWIELRYADQSSYAHIARDFVTESSYNALDTGKSTAIKFLADHPEQIRIMIDDGHRSNGVHFFLAIGMLFTLAGSAATAVGIRMKPALP